MYSLSCVKIFFISDENSASESILKIQIYSAQISIWRIWYSNKFCKIQKFQSHPNLIKLGGPKDMGAKLYIPGWFQRQIKTLPVRAFWKSKFGRFLEMENVEWMENSPNLVKKSNWRQIEWAPQEGEIWLWGWIDFFTKFGELKFSILQKDTHKVDSRQFRLGFGEFDTLTNFEKSKNFKAIQTWSNLVDPRIWVQNFIFLAGFNGKSKLCLWERFENPNLEDSCTSTNFQNLDFNKI